MIGYAMIALCITAVILGAGMVIIGISIYAANIYNKTVEDE